MKSFLRDWLWVIVSAAMLVVVALMRDWWGVGIWAFVGGAFTLQHFLRKEDAE